MERDKTAKRQKINRGKAYLAGIAWCDGVLDALSDAIVEMSMRQVQMSDRADIHDAEELIQDLESRYEETARDQARRIKAIEDIGYMRHVDILCAIYIDGASLRTVADMTGMDIRQVRRMRDRALLRLRIPEGGENAG